MLHSKPAYGKHTCLCVDKSPIMLATLQLESAEKMADLARPDNT